MQARSRLEVTPIASLIASRAFQRFACRPGVIRESKFGHARCLRQMHWRRTDAQPRILAAAKRRKPSAMDVEFAHPSDVLRLVVVGDVHYQWEADDERAAEFLAPDAILFVGDFGEEDAELVERIAAFAAREPAGTVAVQLGNHDGWHSMTATGRARLAQQQGPAAAAAMGDSAVSPGVKRQLEALGDAHVGYSALRLPGRRFSVVGGRPFSKGGCSWDGVKKFYKELYGVESLQASAEKLAGSIAAQPAENAVVVLAHNGRAGLGAKRQDIYGVLEDESGTHPDASSPPAGDHGDPDLAAALDAAAERGRPVAACVFGHMHHTCGGDRALRTRLAVTPESSTLHINAAVVPRHKDCRNKDGAPVVGHHFMVLELDEPKSAVVSAKDVWVAADAAGGCAVVAETQLLRTRSVDPLAREVFDVQLERWKAV